MLPFYIYYSMFGFQRVGDLIWAAADQRARGFLLGATAGRTTLGGEGLQHQDGSSLLAAAQVPNCRVYDPATAGELAVLLDHGMREMLERQRDVFYYLALMNENQPQPSLPEGVAEAVISGLYRVAPARGTAQLRLLGSGTLLREVLAAADLLRDDWGVDVEVWSATSYSELAREARELQRWNRLHPGETARESHLQRCLAGDAPIVAASDWVCAWPHLVAPYLDASFTALGTDGFGRSDTRAALRRFFEVDRAHIVLAALAALADEGSVDAGTRARAIERYGIARDDPAPWTC
jgi:pyruvate dehydrogenase E1 component